MKCEFVVKCDFRTETGKSSRNETQMKYSPIDSVKFSRLRDTTLLITSLADSVRLYLLTMSIYSKACTTHCQLTSIFLINQGQNNSIQFAFFQNIKSGL